jgi:hypothetical protein
MNSNLSKYFTIGEVDLDFSPIGDADRDISTNGSLIETS